MSEQKLALLKKLEAGELDKDQVYNILIKSQSHVNKEICESKSVYSSKTEICEKIKDTITLVTGIRTERIDQHSAIDAYGFDSIRFAEFVKRINETFELSIPTSDIVEHNTVAGLCDIIYEYVGQKSVKASGERILVTDPEQDYPGLNQGNSVAERNSGDGDRDHLGDTNLFLIGQYDVFPVNFWDKCSQYEYAYEPISAYKYVHLRKQYKHLLVRVLDTEVEVLSAGIGTSVVILGGAGMAPPMAKRLIEVLSTQYHVIYINQPGCGLSKDIYDYSLKGRAEVIISVLEQLKLRDAMHLIGISWGSLINQQLSVSYPERVKSLVLISPIYHMKEYDASVNANDIMKKDILATSNKKEHEILLSKGSSSNIKILSKVSDYYTLYNKDAYDTERILPSIRVPTIIIYGEKDLVVSNDQSKQIASYIRDSVLVPIQDGGHFVFMTHCNSVTEIVKNFWNKLSQANHPIYITNFSEIIVKTIHTVNNNEFIEYSKRYYDLLAEIDHVLIQHIFSYFLEMGVDISQKSVIEMSDLLATLQVTQSCVMVIYRMIELLKEKGYIRQVSTHIQFIRSKPKSERDGEFSRVLCNKYPDYNEMINLTEAIAAQYRSILSVDYDDNHGNNISDKQASCAYESFHIHTYKSHYIAAISCLLKKLISSSVQPIKALFVGCETELIKMKIESQDIGGEVRIDICDSQEWVDDKLWSDLVRNTSVFSSIKSKDNAEYDIIIANDIAYRSSDIILTLHKMKRLLSKNGVIAIMEMTKGYYWLDIVWGVIRRSMNCEGNSYRGSSPALTVHDWIRCCKTVGFDHIIAYPETFDDAYDSDSTLLLAQNCI